MGTPLWVINTMKSERWISVISFIINLFHLIILSQKSMRTSSVNIILMAIALSIVGWMLRSSPNFLPKMATQCTPPVSYPMAFYRWFIQYFTDYCIRCDALLGITLALIRFIAIKYPSGLVKGRLLFENITKPSFGWKVYSIVSLISFFIVSCHVQTTQLRAATYVWKPSPVACAGMFPENFTQPIYAAFAASPMQIYGGIISISALQLLDAFIFNIIPSIMYPIATVLLIMEINKYTKNRQQLNSSKQKLQNDSTTKLIFCITIVFLISQLPPGLLIFIGEQSFCTGDFCNFISDLHTVSTISTLLCTTTHMPLCLALSTQYRDTLKAILRIRKRNVVIPEQTGMWTTQVNQPGPPLVN